ncbi:recombinase family protein [Hymenobacter norwichensis]|uniref:recombinase family protein n=1 Tax=Hymenobacter norwichensis TaxID=223903 RepID=UPI0008FFD9D1|nr:recombinase family protein [Hymenobacter norwichensis]
MPGCRRPTKIRIRKTNFRCYVGRLSGPVTPSQRIRRRGLGPQVQPQSLPAATSRRRQAPLRDGAGLSRFSREGIEKVFEHTSILEQCGVSFWSYSEPMLNTAGPMKDFMKAVLSWAAGYYSERLSENVKQGLHRKKAQAALKGEEHVHGPRALAPAVVEEIRALQQDGLSVRKISAATGVPVGTVHKYLIKSLTVA